MIWRIICEFGESKGESLCNDEIMANRSSESPTKGANLKYVADSTKNLPCGYIVDLE